MCSYCLQEEEATEHILFKCSFAKIVWEWALKGCEIPTIQVTSISGVHNSSSWYKCKKRRNNFINICYGTIWWIWKARCDRIFKNFRLSPTKVAYNIRSQVFTWIKHSRRNCKYRWVDWAINPFHVFFTIMCLFLCNLFASLLLLF